jgi:hypothetical protein
MPRLLGSAVVEKWSKQQLLYWLDANKMKYLKYHFVDEEEKKTLPEKYITKETKMWEKHGTRTNLLVLIKAPAKRLVSLLTLPAKCTRFFICGALEIDRAVLTLLVSHFQLTCARFGHTKTM